MRNRSAGQETAGSCETRCAIYTRKSSEEGLEQEFNSLHAQREACQAYILSQRHEGWRALPALYDDGGISGGTMGRPALARLLDDIRAKRIDLVVIYKVDRLTRSLADFAKLVDVFNASNVSFVSVTQQFNTATSMGRLTLNMLLSFAQFEREVTGERIRDKIAASKRKGMWMGGYSPLGYDVWERKLVVNQREAVQVERIFRLYTELGSVRLLQEQLAAEGITTKRRALPEGRTGGGRPLLRGNLYEMLQNRLYRGEVAHKDNVYPGEHSAIIDPALWDQVQAELSDRRVERTTRSRSAQPSLLAGMVYDAADHRLTPSHAKKGSKRYRYYVSKSLIADTADKADGMRLPAGELDMLVIGALLKLIRAPSTLLEAVGHDQLEGVEQRQLLSAAARFAIEWDQLGAARVRFVVRVAIARVVVQPDRVMVSVTMRRLTDLILGRDEQHITNTTESQGAPHVISVPASLRRAGQEMRLVVEGDHVTAVDATLAKLVHQGLQFRDQLLTAQDIGIAELATAAGVSGSHFTRVLRLGFLAPDILAAIASGRQPVGFTATKLLRDTRLPLAWSEQRTLLGFPAPV